MKRIFIIILFSLLFSAAYAYEDFKDLKKQADNGDQHAQYILGDWYTGLHEQADYIMALKYLRLSASQGNIKAKERITELTQNGYERWGDFIPTPIYDFGIIPVSERYIFDNGIKNGDCGAALILAHSYFAEDDFKNAVKYYELCLSMLSPDKYGKIGDEEMIECHVVMDATTMLGYCYEQGLGVSKDLNIALGYYELLGGYLDTPDPEVCYSIATILKKYNNTTLNTYAGPCGGKVYDAFFPASFALRGISKAPAIYFKLKKFNYALEYVNGLDSEKVADPRILWIAESYYNGLGHQQDYKKAFNLFHYLTCDAKNSWDEDFKNEYPDIYADACYRLYECYAMGRGTQKNATEAQYYFQESLRYGSSSALYDDQRRYEITSH